MIVIADDITGAAEIAGIAFSHGQQARLVCATDSVDASSVCCDTSSVCCDTGSVYCDSVAVTTVIATDTRSMSETEAIAETRRIGTALSPLAPSPRERAGVRSYLFKKTDSALRGHVVAELTALMDVTGYQRAVYLPANPSKERIIRNGIYYIKGIPIADTAFNYDPEFPAHTSSLKERFPDAEAKGIIMPDAESMDDIRRIVGRYDDGRTLFAGAADLLTAILPKTQHLFSHTCKTCSSPATLILCGSTQSKPLNLGIPVAPMPRQVYDGEQGADHWLAQLTTSLPGQGGTSLILTIPHTHRTGKEVAVHLRTVMAEMASRLISLYRPDQLIIEGGATAWATLNALGWHDFQIERQVAPGVVQMSATNGTLVTLKPGSYPWGELFQSFSE
jgi:uncharacterized protein YgbK (DUF1537 family)